MPQDSAVPTLRHPYLADYQPGQPLSPCSVGDALNSMSATVWLLADLFVVDHEDEILNSKLARQGMFNQLATLADTLEFLSQHAAQVAQP